MLLKDLSLEDTAIFFKGIDQIEGNGAICVVIPYLDQIDAVPVPEEWYTFVFSRISC